MNWLEADSIRAGLLECGGCSRSTQKHTLLKLPEKFRYWYTYPPYNPEFAPPDCRCLIHYLFPTGKKLGWVLALFAKNKQRLVQSWYHAPSWKIHEDIWLNQSLSWGLMIFCFTGNVSEVLVYGKKNIIINEKAPVLIHRIITGSKIKKNMFVIQNTLTDPRVILL